MLATIRENDHSKVDRISGHVGKIIKFRNYYLCIPWFVKLTRIYFGCHIVLTGLFAISGFLGGASGRVV